MYCKYCGKYLLGERDICDECLAKQNQAHRKFMQYDNCEKQTELKNEVEDCKEKQSQQNGNDQTPAKKRNLFWIKGPLSVLSALLANFLFVFCIDIIFLGKSNEIAILGIFLFFIMVALGILALILACNSMSDFSSNKNINKTGAIISLVFGIIGFAILIYPFVNMFIIFPLFEIFLHA